MKILTGDLIKLAVKGEFDLIIHGCNCFCTMGAGIAKTIKEKFPEAYRADLETEKGARSKLGQISWGETKIESGTLIIVNGYPAIGAGLAGGEWEVISKIIEEELKGENHIFVEYQR